MIALLLFSVIAVVIVWIAGRKDAALDPRLTTVALGLLAGFPVLMVILPKVAVLPTPQWADDGGIPWMLVLVAVWAVGFGVALARLGIAMRGLVGWRKRSALLEGRDGVEIRMLPGLRGPVAAGVFRKVVFVPEEWQTWDDGRRNIVLDHELAHHRRRDPLRRWVAGLAVAVNWFNPLVRWIVKRLLIQCEFACDAEVLKRGVRAKDYAALLCDMAEDAPGQGLALAMAERSGLETRIRRIMVPRNDERTLETSWLILFAVAMAGLLAILGSEKIVGYTHKEIELRRTANPFPR